jgi:hypothetical protein
VACSLAAITVFAAVAAQQPGFHPVSWRVYALPMGVAGAGLASLIAISVASASFALATHC